MSSVKPAELAVRELQVLLGVGEGKTSVEIAGELKLSNETVRFYLKRLRDKTAIRRKSLLAVWAANNRNELARTLVRKERANGRTKTTN